MNQFISSVGAPGLGVCLSASDPPCCANGHDRRRDMYDSRSDRRINFKQPTMTGKSTRKLTAKPKCNDRRADRRINSLAAWELQRLTVQGKGLVPTSFATQKTWHRPPAQGVAPRPRTKKPRRASLDVNGALSLICNCEILASHVPNLSTDSMNYSVPRFISSRHGSLEPARTKFESPRGDSR